MTNLTYKLGEIVGGLPTREEMSDHKFVICRINNGDSTELTFHSKENKGGLLHRHIVESECRKDERCVGGGLISYFTGTSRILQSYYGDESLVGTYVGDKSTDYGPVHTKILDAFGDILSKTYGIVYIGHGFFEGDIVELNGKWERRHKINL